MDENLCPICINNEAECFTECKHGYCVTCLCRIEKCALCRKKLNRRVLNSQITFHYIMKHSRKNVVSRNDSVVSRGERISEREGIYVDPENYQPNRTDPPWTRIDNTPWSFALDPEHNEPSGYVPGVSIERHNHPLPPQVSIPESSSTQSWSSSVQSVAWHAIDFLQRL